MADRKKEPKKPWFMLKQINKANVWLPKKYFYTRKIISPSNYVIIAIIIIRETDENLSAIRYAMPNAIKLDSNKMLMYFTEREKRETIKWSRKNPLAKSIAVFYFFFYFWNKQTVLHTDHFRIYAGQYKCETKQKTSKNKKIPQDIFISREYALVKISNCVDFRSQFRQTLFCFLLQKFCMLFFISLMSVN